MDASRLRKISVLFLYAMIGTFVLTGCYHRHRPSSPDAVVYTEQQLDSISFSTTHHYSQNYNFVVKADSIVLLRQQPEEMLNQLLTDSLVVRKNDNLVVADIRMIPTDSIDSVWVQLARDQETFGWIHESELLPQVYPDDPISQFISVFSDVHLLLFLFVIVIIGVAYLARLVYRSNAKIVHFNDINSFYPTLLALLVASSATLYASIQTFAPDMWRHFYYHPTLNPFITPTLLSVFLVSVWAIVIVALAVVDDVFRQLAVGEAILYLCGLAAICAVNYMIFSVFTLYYIGYILLAVYFFFALRTYFSESRYNYICGHCGAQLHKKGRCPQCGTLNQ